MAYVFPYIHIVKLKTTSRPKLRLVKFSPNFTGMFLGWTITQNKLKELKSHEEFWLPWQPIEKT